MNHAVPAGTVRWVQVVRVRSSFRISIELIQTLGMTIAQMQLPWFPFT